MIVMKFGGTSVGSVEAISRTISIIKGRLDQKPVVVVSAMSKVTDLLYRIADTAASKDVEKAAELVGELRIKHITTAEQLLEGSVDPLLNAISAVNEICDGLEQFVRAISVLGELSARSKAVIVSVGERLSSTIICQAMNASGIKTNWIDARKMIITNGDSMKGEPDLTLIQQKAPEVISAAYEGCDAVITQGFVAADRNGEPTVLGRGGSDYSASLIGMAVDASVIEIWTDVDGVLTADPRMVNGTRKLEMISFEEATEMAHFGAKVLHPLTIEPAVRKNIPIYVLNSMNPSYKGTAILSSEKIEDGVKSVSFKENIQVINVFSTKMINVSGFLGKVFEIFGRNHISVDLISTSEANISVTVDGTQDISKVVEELSEVGSVVVDTNKSQVSVVGKNLVNVPGIMDKIFSPLAGTRTYMISQGASYINLSIVVDRSALNATVNSIHDSLFS